MISWNKEEHKRIKDDLKVLHLKRTDIVSGRGVVLEKNVDFEVKVEMFSGVLRRERSGLEIVTY